jgi:hypothetical protein
MSSGENIDDYNYNDSAIVYEALYGDDVAKAYRQSTLYNKTLAEENKKKQIEKDIQKFMKERNPEKKKKEIELPTELQGVRVVSINGIAVPVHDDYRPDRVNVVVTSEQFKKMCVGRLEKYLDRSPKEGDIPMSFIIGDLFYKNANKLTDLVVKIDGNY